MRVAVVGATGNAGTALLEALQSTPEVTSVLGIARRMPDTSVEPYRDCEWASIDVGAASSAAQAVEQLTAAFRGVDTVVHLAWLIQPNRRRELLRRVNVDGTERVARAAAAAGVSHLVVASSVGAYAPDRERTLRDESWPRGGIRTSHYSVDKVAQERVLDAFGAEHPGVLVTRLRPALIFGRDAASEIQRYFLSRFVPVQALRFGRLPALPLPNGFRGVQAVHSDDIGRAYAAAIVARAPGAFNIAADDVLTGPVLAGILDHGRVVGVPAQLMRQAMDLTYRSRAIAADPGWFDMGMHVPLLDTAKAAAELDWRPQHTAVEALESLLGGMIAGAGADTVPMQPRDARRASVPGTSQSTVGDGAHAHARTGTAVGDGADTGAPGAKGESEGGEVDARAAQAASAGQRESGAGKHAAPRRTPVPRYQPRSRSGGARIDDTIADDLLNLYLSDHLTGATAGSSRIARMATAYIDTPVYTPLSELATEIALEREFLGRLIDDLGMRRLSYRQIVSWVGERAARLKHNGVIARRSPMTLVLETELMRSAIMGKLGVWQTLEEHAEQLGLDRRVFADLVRLALEQVSALNAVHRYARGRAFRTDRLTFTPYTAGDDHAASGEGGDERGGAGSGTGDAGGDTTSAADAPGEPDSDEPGDEALEGDDARLGTSET